MAPRSQTLPIAFLGAVSVVGAGLFSPLTNGALASASNATAKKAGMPADPLSGRSADVRKALAGGDARFLSLYASLPVVRKDLPAWKTLKDLGIVKGLRSKTTQLAESSGPASDSVITYTLSAAGYPTFAVESKDGKDKPVFKATYSQNDPSKPVLVEETWTGSSGEEVTYTTNFVWQETPVFPVFFSQPEKVLRDDGGGVEETIYTCSSATSCRVITNSVVAGKTSTWTDITKVHYNAVLMEDVQDSFTATNASRNQYSFERRFSDGRLVGWVIKDRDSGGGSDPRSGETPEIPTENLERCSVTRSGVATCQSEFKRLDTGATLVRENRKFQLVLVLAGGVTASIEEFPLEYGNTYFSEADPSKVEGSFTLSSSYDASWNVAREESTSIGSDVDPQTGVNVPRNETLVVEHVYDSLGRPETKTVKATDGTLYSVQKYAY